MKNEEIILFNVHGLVDDESIKNWKKITSAIINDVRIIVDKDGFLRERINELRFEWKYDPTKEDPFYAHIDRQGGKISKDLIVNIPALHRVVNLQQELLFQLYKLPGEEKNTNRLPNMQRKLKKWVNKLGNDFFVLYPSYHSQLKAAGIQFGLMKKYPKYKERILDLYLEILENGVSRKRTLYDLGDVEIEILKKGLPKRTSLFKLGSVRLLINYGNDYLAHYVTGTPVSTMPPVFSLTNSEVDAGMGSELKKRINDVYKGLNPLVSERLSEHTKLIGRDTFDECFYPSLTEEENYLSLVEEHLGNCVEMKKLMHQQHAHSLIKPNSDKKYVFNMFDFSNATRELGYIR